ncbi:MAG: carbohydrate kinase family protein [Candidatus Woesebacteria bacterium]
MKLILTGSIAIDRIMSYDGRYADVIQPDKLHVLSLSVLLSQMRETRGGVAANIAYTLALLGEKPLLYGSVGQNGLEYMDSLKDMGIDTSKVHFSILPTAAFNVITDKANCQVGGFYPGAMSDAKSLRIEPFKNDTVFVVISPHDPAQMAFQVKECKKLKKRMCYDIGQQASNVSGKDIQAGIEACELLIVNDYEMGVLTEKTGWSQEKIVAMVKTVVVTLGEKGSLVWSEGRRHSVSALKVKKVVDPTGAGDAFRSGFLYGYIQDVDPVICAKLGATAAAFAVEVQGTQAHHFTKTQFRTRYQKQFGSLSILE